MSRNNELEFGRRMNTFYLNALVWYCIIETFSGLKFPGPRAWGITPSLSLMILTGEISSFSSIMNVPCVQMHKTWERALPQMSSLFQNNAWRRGHFVKADKGPLARECPTRIFMSKTLWKCPRGLFIRYVNQQVRHPGLTLQSKEGMLFGCQIAAN